MQIPLLDLKQQYHLLKSKINAALTQVMEEASFVRGPQLQQFEEAFARYHGASEICIGLNSGTDALILILNALGAKPGDEVITVPFTFIAPAEAIAHTGATVKFVDVDPDRYTLDPAQLEQAITSKTVGILPVHLFGMPADMDPLLAIAQKHHLWVVEDACQAHGSSYKGRKAGTLGNAAAFSFYPTKNLGAYGDGGAVLTRDKNLAEKIKLLHDHGQRKKYYSEVVGYNSRLDSFQAAVLNIKLAYLDEWNKKRREVASWYAQGLAGIQAIQRPKTYPDSQEVYHLYNIKAENRDKLAAYLQTQGISTGTYYVTPIHQQPAFRHEKTGAFPVSEKLSTQLLSLPMYPELTQEQVTYIAEKVKAFYS